MTETGVRKIVEANLERLMRELGIPHWSVTVEYCRIDAAESGYALSADCRALDAYERANIRFDADRFGTEDEVLRVLEHELLHIVISPIYAIRDALSPYIPGGPAWDSFMACWATAEERTVKNLERLRKCSRGPCDTLSATLPKRP